MDKSKKSRGRRGGGGNHRHQKYTTLLMELGLKVEQCRQEIRTAGRVSRELVRRASREALQAKMVRLCRTASLVRTALLDSRGRGWTNMRLQLTDAEEEEELVSLLRLVREGESEALLRRLFTLVAALAHQAKHELVSVGKSTPLPAAPPSKFASMLIDVLRSVAHSHGNGILRRRSGAGSHARGSEVLEPGKIRHSLIRAWLLEPVGAGLLSLSGGVAGLGRLGDQEEEEEEEGTGLQRAAATAGSESDEDEDEEDDDDDDDDDTERFLRMRNAFRPSFEELLGAYEDEMVARIAFTLGASCIRPKHTSSSTSALRIGNRCDGDVEDSDDEDRPGNRDLDSSIFLIEDVRSESDKDEDDNDDGAPRERRVGDDPDMPQAAQIQLLLRFALSGISEEEGRKTKTNTDATFWARARAVRTALAMCHLPAVEAAFFGSRHSSMPGEPARRRSLLAAFEAIETMARFERLRLPHTFNQVNLGHPFALLKFTAAGGNENAPANSGAVAVANTREGRRAKDTKDRAARLVGLVGGLWRDHCGDDAPASSSSAESVADPLEDLPLACTRLVGLMMVDQERRRGGTFREQLPGLWRALIVRLLQQGQARFLLSFLEDVRASAVIQQSPAVDADLAAVWRATVHAPLVQARDKVRRQKALRSCRPTLLQVVRLVELCPPKEDYVVAVQPAKVARVLCGLYAATGHGWLLTLAARAALAAPGRALGRVFTGDAAQSKRAARRRGQAARAAAAAKASARDCKRAAILYVVRRGGGAELLDLLAAPPIPGSSGALVAQAGRAAVYDAIDACAGYACVQTGKGVMFFRSFVGYLIRQRRVRGLLQHAIVFGRLKEARQLVDMFHQAHPRMQVQWSEDAGEAAPGLDGTDREVVAFSARALGVDRDVLVGLEEE